MNHASARGCHVPLELRSGIALLFSFHFKREPSDREQRERRCPAGRVPTEKREPSERGVMFTAAVSDTALFLLPVAKPGVAEDDPKQRTFSTANTRPVMSLSSWVFESAWDAGYR